jgi:hypothetical protein
MKRGAMGTAGVAIVGTILWVLWSGCSTKPYRGLEDTAPSKIHWKNIDGSYDSDVNDRPKSE